MPLNSVPAVVSVGVNPPPNPDAKTLWLSQSLMDLRPSQGLGDRFPVISPTLSWEQGVCQEPSVWYANGQWNMLFTGGSGSPALGLATAPTPSGPWTKYAGNPVLGQGAGGWAGKAFHSSIYIEGSTIYCYFPDTTNNVLKVATASLSDPTTWTVQGTVMSLPSGGTQWGNSAVIKDGSTYWLLYEALESGWQLGLASGASPTGPFNNIQFRFQNLWPGGKQFTASGPNLFKEGSTYVLYYHSGPYSNNTLPTDGYRATSQDLLNWTIDLNGSPLISRVAPQEIDQVADLCLAQGPNEGWWLFWTAYDNQTPASSVMCCAMRETVKRWDGYEWAPIIGTADPTAQKGYTGEQPFSLVVLQNTNYTAAHRDDVPVDATAANLTVTLPRAAQGSIVRVSHVGTGANTVTVSASGTDSILGTNAALTTGQTATYRCYTAGKWNRQG